MRKRKHIENEETNEKLGKYLQHIKEEKNYCIMVSLKIKNRENQKKSEEIRKLLNTKNIYNINMHMIELPFHTIEKR